MKSPVTAVLFDLDGTLLDTAPDLGAALNHVCTLHNRPPVAAEIFTPYASHGSRGLLNLAFAEHMVDMTSHTAEQLKQQFLGFYHDNIANHSRLFEGVEQLLNDLTDQNIAVAIVTNKPIALTQRLLPYFPALANIDVIVGGDSLHVAKPHPEPLLHACQQLGCEPQDCLYVGDAERDIQAGQNAGMTTALAAYGYITADDNPSSWGADYQLQQPLDLLTLITNNAKNLEQC